MVGGTDCCVWGCRGCLCVCCLFCCLVLVCVCGCFLGAGSACVFGLMVSLLVYLSQLYVCLWVVFFDCGLDFMV